MQVFHCHQSWINVDLTINTGKNHNQNVFGRFSSWTSESPKKHVAYRHPFLLRHCHLPPDPFLAKFIIFVVCLRSKQSMVWIELWKFQQLQYFLILATQQGCMKQRNHSKIIIVKNLSAGQIIPKADLGKTIWREGFPYLTTFKEIFWSKNAVSFGSRWPGFVGSLFSTWIVGSWFVYLQRNTAISWEMVAILI